MNIVILDGYTTNPGDLTWEAFEKQGNTVVYDRTPHEKLIERAKNADVLLTADVPIDQALMAALPNLKYIGVLATGYNIVDLEGAKAHGICVTNVPSYSTTSVAQMTMALLLELCHRTDAHSRAVHEGEWTKALDYCFWNYPLVELHGKTIGIVGAGRIGQLVAKMAEAFGMRVIYSAPRPNKQLIESGYPFMSIEDLLKISDVVSLHCPLTPETEGMIDAKRIALMKKEAFLINVSRGRLIVEKDLAHALEMGLIAGAGLDVLSTEPPQKDNPLLGVKNCIITPHIAWAPKESRQRLIDVAAKNLEAYRSKQPINVVSIKTEE